LTTLVAEVIRIDTHPVLNRDRSTCVLQGQDIIERLGKPADNPDIDLINYRGLSILLSVRLALMRYGEVRPSGVRARSPRPKGDV
jgi:hypothetical protein